jgi:hypothetical protein
VNVRLDALVEGDGVGEAAGVDLEASDGDLGNAEFGSVVTPRFDGTLLEEFASTCRWHQGISATWTSPTFVPVGPVRSKSSSALKK